MLFQTANKHVHTDSVNLSCCGITWLSAQQAEVDLTCEVQIPGAVAVLTHISPVEPWYFAFCHQSIKINRDLGPKLGTVPT